MPLLDVNGVAINYIDEGTGPAVVLVHGFAASLQANWRAPGIIDTIRNSGRRVIALDCRGHGRSGKPLDPHAYEGTKMADDVIAVMELLGEADTLVGSADQVAAAIPGAKLVKVPGNHLTAVVAPELRRALISFLDEHSPVPAK